VDFNISSTQKMFGRFTIRRELDGDNVNFLAPAVFPGDPLSHVLELRDYAYVVGHTWTITNNMVNQLIYGETRQRFATPNLSYPLGITDYSQFGNISNPYLSPSGQFRHIPVPEFKDDFTYVRGGHTFQAGATFKPITVLSSLGNSFNDVTLGLGGAFLPSLDSNARPPDIESDSANAADLLWDQALPFYIGRYGLIAANYNYNGKLLSQPIGTPSNRLYKANETEAYLQDSWKVRKDLTLSYGVRYVFYQVPYEENGLEAVSNTNFAQYITPRIQSGLQGTGACYQSFQSPAPVGIPACGPNMPTGNPLTSFVLGGKANHGPGYYHPDWRDFAPRLGFAYNPSLSEGLLGKVFGDRRTVIRGGAGIVFDHPAVESVQFVQNQVAALFVSGQQANFPLSGAGSSAAATLAGGPFFSTIGEVPAGLPSAPTVSLPYTPYTDFVGNGVVNNTTNYEFDANFKTPYSEMVSFGIQRELADHFQLDVNYFGRFGRRLMGPADAGELVDFKDPTSGQMMSQAFIGLAKDLRAGNFPTAQPFFDNLVTDPFGLTGTQLIGLTSLGPFAARGDMGSTLYILQSNGFMPFGVGFNPQYVYDVFFTNKSASNYHGLLTTLHRKFAQGLQFDLNYTYAHSIDNLSAIANNVLGIATNYSGGILCDPINLHVCRANSDFDIRHEISADGLYNLPFGRGKFFGSQGPGWVDRIFGGWQLAGDMTWRSGLAFTTLSNAFPLSFDNDTPAIFTGNNSALQVHVHKDPSTGRIQLFSNPTSALGAFSEPLGFQVGSRNNLRGPRYANVDLALNKHLPIREKYVVEFRAEAFNVFNHPSFGLPGGGLGFPGTADISNPAQFGVITQTASVARIMQFALRLDF
jgi:hypothetical protein